MRALLFGVMILAIGAGSWFILSNGNASVPESAPATAQQAPQRTAQAPAEGRSGGGSLLSRWLAPGGGSDSTRGGSVYYQYLDDSGSVHFVRSLADVPPAWRDRAGRVELDRKPRVARAAAATPKRRRPFAEPVVPVRRASSDVVVYTTPWCGWCRKTMAWLDRKGVDYENRDIEADDRNRTELLQKTGRTSIPVVEIDGQLIRGYDPARMEQLLRAS